MKRCDDWIVFYSRTGSEIVRLVNELGIAPRAIVTNVDITSVSRAVSELASKHQIPIIFMPSRPTEENYNNVLRKTDLITLHGWLRVVPASICKNHACRMFNLHPGLITTYPDLKGKDPQVRTIAGGYETCGCVIHEVTAGVDEGLVVDAREIKCVPETIYQDLGNLAINMWSDFLNSRLNLIDVWIDFSKNASDNA